MKAYFFRAVLLASWACACTAIAAAEARVTTRYGELLGLEQNGVAAFKGIPFAEPPVGDLRWRAPRPPKPWQGVRRADQPGPVCMQTQRPGAEQPMSEDCLYLNVWKPAKPGARRLPVMVFLHAGGFTVGSGTQPALDGTSLAKRGVVVVTTNYRLGNLGFFAHPALAKEDPEALLGNYGLLDQIAALQWVRDNITAFGGDPKNVTLFGESAGGKSVNLLMVAPQARGLFHKAIVQSGVLAGPTKTLRDAQYTDERVANAWSAEATDAAAMRKLPAETVLTRPPGTGNAGPIVDGKLIPEDVPAAFAAGRVARVPYIVGTNSYEAGFFPNSMKGLSELLAADWSRVEAVYDGYGTREPAAITGQLATDLLFTAPTRTVARSAARNGLPTYVYFYSYLRPTQRGSLPGALHGDEIYPVFGTMNVVEKQLDSSTQRVTDDMQSRWVQFAKTGKPSMAGAPWPAFKPGAESVLEFTMDGVTIHKSFARERLDLADSIGFVPSP